MKLPEKLPAGCLVTFSPSGQAPQIVAAWLAAKSRKFHTEFEELNPADITGCVMNDADELVMVSEGSANHLSGDDTWRSLDYYAANLQSEFVREYLACALFTCSEIEPQGGCDFVECGQAETEAETLSDCAKKEAETDCLEFIGKCAQAGIPFPIPFYALRKSESVNAAHDFHYSRNGHGAGFWEEMERGETCENPHTAAGKLQAIAKGFGSAELYRGDDGKLYF